MTPSKRRTKTAPTLKRKIGLRRRQDLVTRRVGYDLGVYDPETQLVHILNATAATIWDHIEPGRSYDDIGTAMALSYGYQNKDANIVAGDAFQIIQELKMEGLLLTTRQKDPEPKKTKVPKIYHPNRDATRISSLYESASLKTYTPDKLLTKFKLDRFPGTADFIDTWL